ncbi:hypothetical protein MSG28_012626, partial [Choristoneura fumiferana]
PEFSKPPSSPVPDAGASKAAYKSGEILDMPPPITLETPNSPSPHPVQSPMLAPAKQRTSPEKSWTCRRQSRWRV